MLILTRKIGEGIVLNDDVKIHVMEISKGLVKLGIDAPKNMLILREELANAIKETNLEANKSVDATILRSLSQKLK